NATAEKIDVTRKEQIEWAYRRHQRATNAIDTGKFAVEIVPHEVPQRKGDTIDVDTDEAPQKNTNVEKLATHPPACEQNGTVTAGNAPGVNDGACAFVVMSDEKAASLGKTAMATVHGHAEVAVEAENFPETPGLVINKLLEKTGYSKDEIDLFEINEAFAVVSLASGKIAGIDMEKVNVNGGAVALGHPIGASGARIILTLIHELKRRGGGL